jgi:DNA-directed RNA polymerase subunit RPC12/RpoP
LTQFKCAYCGKVNEKENVRLMWGLVLRCQNCSKKNLVYVVTYEQAWKEIIGDHPYPDHTDAESK